MRFSIYQESKRGGRKSNQDRMGYCFTRDALLMVVADGMGGHVQGEIAAQIAVQTIGSAFQREATPMLPSPSRFLETSIFEAHRAILEYRASNRLSESPRTTVVACVVQKGAAFWAHAGDSRLYWIRAGEVIAQTRDHSKIQSMIQQGLASPAEIDTHPDRNKLFNCLGSPEAPDGRAVAQDDPEAGRHAVPVHRRPVVGRARPGDRDGVRAQHRDARGARPDQPRAVRRRQRRRQRHRRWR